MSEGERERRRERGREEREHPSRDEKGAIFQNFTPIICERRHPLKQTATRRREQRDKYT